MTRSAEDQARQYLRLFPTWMRADRGEEALGLTLDQLAPGATALPLRSKLELARAGLHARRRGTPPLSVWGRLCWSGGWQRDPAVPVQWRAWLGTVIMTRWITVAYALTRVSFVLVYPVMQVLLPREGGEYWYVAGPIVWAVFGFGCWALGRKRWRSRVLHANGFDQDGRPLPPHEVGFGWSRQTVPNVWVVPSLAGFALVGAVYGPIAWVQADAATHGPALLTSLLVVAAVASGVGVARARLADVASGPPTMTMVVKSDRVRCALSAATGACVGVLWAWLVAALANVAGVHLVVAFAGPLAAVAVIMLALRAERSLGRRVGEWDLHPAWAPQLVERPMRDLPRPPAGPSTPALG